MPTPPKTRSASKAQQYFAQQAQGYDTASRRGLWSFLRRLETPAVLDLAQITAGERVLDAGSGAGHYTEALLGAGAAVTAMDLEPAMLASVHARLGVETIQGDLMTANIPPIFDKVVCAGVLEFVADPAAAVANLARALRPDGPRTMIVLVAARSLGGFGYWLTRRCNGINMPLFTRRGLDRLAAAGNLRVEQATRAGYNWVARLRATDLS